MKILCYIILIISALKLINYILLAVYCRFAEYMDNRTRIQISKANNVSCPNASEITSEKNKKSKGVKHVLGVCYSKANGYLYGWMRYCIVCVGKFPSHRIRNILYRKIFNMKITKRTIIYGECEIRSPWNIHADNCVISTGCILDGRKGIRIGQNTVFGGHVHIWTEEHDLDDPFFSVNTNHAQPVIIGDRCWICSDSTVLPGVHIENGTVIASRAVVTRDCTSFSVYAGIPAKKIRNRNRELKYELSGKPHWHFW